MSSTSDLDLMVDKAKSFKNIVYKRRQVIASVNLAYLHANHVDRTRSLTIVSLLKYKMYRKKALHKAGTRTCRVCTIGFADLIRTWHGISSCYYLEKESND